MKDFSNASFPPETINTMKNALEAAVASLPDPVSSHMCRETVTGRYIHTLDTLLVMAADTVAGFIKGLLKGKRFCQTSYALDRSSREPTLVRLFEQMPHGG